VLHPPSLASLFIYSSCGKCPFPPLQWSFPHTTTFTGFPTPRLLGGYHHSCLLWSVCLFTVCEGLPLPPFGAQGTLPFFLCLFVVVVHYLVCFLSLFSLGMGQSVQGAMLIWPRVVCGSTMCHLAHLVVCILLLVGNGVWRCGSPLGISIY
jgi:hypothetical protein